MRTGNVSLGLKVSIFFLIVLALGLLSFQFGLLMPDQSGVEPSVIPVSGPVPSSRQAQLQLLTSEPYQSPASSPPAD